MADGIISYSTPGHGGIWLSAARQAQLGYADNFLKTPQWWEEDCDWSVPYIFFAADIRAHGTAYKFEENLVHARLIAAKYHPDFALVRECVC